MPSYHPADVERKWQAFWAANETFRTPDPGESWFPLPSYVATNYVGGGPTWHHVKLSYWFLILVYLGLWQLPWLLRYHRRQRIQAGEGRLGVRVVGVVEQRRAAREVTQLQAPLRPRGGGQRRRGYRES